MGRHLFRQFTAIAFGLLCGGAWLEAGILPDNSAAGLDMPVGESLRRPDAQGLLGPEAFSLEMPDNPLVEKALRYFESDGGLDWLAEGMRAAEPFRDFIMASLSSRNMPLELYYVAMIESTFDIRARSNSGAAGIWQFMLNSIGTWMRHNEWVDERYDFWASTKGAIEKLADNYQVLGDWSLALAAYNAGLGRISRLVKKTGARSFWDLADDPDLPAETRSYVPRILAAARIGSQAVRHGLPVFWGSAVDWCKVEIRQTLRISRLETLAGLPRGLLRMGNAELRFDLTPPGKTHFLKIPRRYLPIILAALDNPDLRYDFVTHTVVKGDTLFSLSRLYRTKPQLLESYNPGIQAGQLKIGHKLVIPLVPSGNLSEERVKEAAS